MKRMSHVHKEQKLPVVLGVDEVTRLLEAAANLKHRAALSVAYGAGLWASEIVHLMVSALRSVLLGLLGHLRSPLFLVDEASPLFASKA